MVGRGSRRWGVRVPIAAVAALLGCGAVLQPLAFSLRFSAADKAHALAPWDGRLTALYARREAESGRFDRAQASAREALRQEPTAVPAVSTLGLAAQMDGRTAAARRLFDYAQRLSRRDYQTQLWAIEDAVARGDVAGALRHYDIALRTFKSAPDLLFPVLASAGAEPAVRATLIQTLAGRPAWGPAFIGYVATSRNDPRSAELILREAVRNGIPVSKGIHTALINALVTQSFYGRAWSYYAMAKPGVDRHRSRDPDFTGSGDSPSPFDWAPVNDAGISASIQRVNGGDVFDFSVSSGLGGVVLRQMQMLPPGTYRIDGRSAGISGPEAMRPRWTLACLNGLELGRVVLPESASADGRFAGQLTVPAGCPVQYLSLIVAPSDSLSGTSGQIRKALLHPAP